MITVYPQKFPNINAVIFDLDGLLINTDELLYDSLSNYLKSRYQVNLTHDYFSAHFGKGNKLFYQKIASLCQTKKTEEEIWDDINSQLDFTKVSLKKGAVELLEHLKRINLPATIATNTHYLTAEKMANQAGLAPFFDLKKIICGNQVAGLKPEPDLYLAASASLDQLPKNCLALEDSPAGLESAQAAGCLTWFVPNRYLINSREVAQRYKVITYPSLLEVRKALS